jgi:hypothetical protein
MGPKEGTMSGTLSSGNVCTKLQRIAEMAREHPEPWALVRIDPLVLVKIDPP